MITVPHTKAAFNVSEHAKIKSNYFSSWPKNNTYFKSTLLK